MKLFTILAKYIIAHCSSAAFHPRTKGTYWRTARPLRKYVHDIMRHHLYGYTGIATCVSWFSTEKPDREVGIMGLLVSVKRRTPTCSWGQDQEHRRRQRCYYLYSVPEYLALQRRRCAACGRCYHHQAQIENPVLANDLAAPRKAPYSTGAKSVIKLYAHRTTG